MINAPCVPTAALHPQPHTSVAEGEAPRHSSIGVSFSPFHSALLFLFLLVDVVPIFLIICSPSCDLQTAAAGAGADGDGGEAVTFKLVLGNSSLSDALGTR